MLRSIRNIKGARTGIFLKTHIQKRLESTTKHGLNLEEKKKGSFFLKALGFTTLASLGYSGIVYYASHDESFRSTYLKYAPYGQETLDYVEALEKEMSKPNPDTLGVFKKQLESMINKMKEAVNQIGSSEPKKLEVKKTETETETETEIKPKVNSVKVDEKHLRKLQSLIKQFKPLLGDEPHWKAFNEAVEEFLKVNGKRLATDEERAYSYSLVLNTLSKLQPYLEASFEKATQNTLNDQQISNNVNEDLLNKQKEELEAAHHNTISEIHAFYQRERDNITEAHKKQLEDALASQAASLERWWKRESRIYIDLERNGRLSKLNEALQQLKLLEDSFITGHQTINSDAKKRSLICAVDALQEAVKDPSPAKIVEVVRYLEQTSDVSPLAKVVIQSLTSTSYNDLATLNQLKSRFFAIKSEVQSSALASEDAGFLGHMVSYVFSSFLFNKQGNVEGNDVEAILARSQFYLDKNDLESATREFNQLQGWPKVLAKDWLKAAIRRLEFEQAVEVLKAELRLMNLSRLD